MMASFGKLAARSRSAPMIIQSIAPKSHIGSLSLFSTAPAAALKNPSPPGNGRSPILPTKILPPSPAPENLVWKIALQDVQKKQKDDINGLQWMLDSLRIARMPTSGTPTAVVVPKPAEQHHIFQAMNRNARKPKRANHGKRPCSRIRRRYKVKKWANTSRKG